MAHGLDDIVSELLLETPDVTVHEGREYERKGIVFAARPERDAVELRLGPDIAEAALRTEGTQPSSRGDDWVTLRTSDWSSVRDRLEAWYRVAWRLAGKR